MVVFKCYYTISQRCDVFLLFWSSPVARNNAPNVKNLEFSPNFWLSLILSRFLALFVFQSCLFHRLISVEKNKTGNSFSFNRVLCMSACILLTAAAGQQRWVAEHSDWAKKLANIACFRVKASRKTRFALNWFCSVLFEQQTTRSTMNLFEVTIVIIHELMITETISSVITTTENLCFLKIDWNYHVIIY